MYLNKQSPNGGKFAKSCHPDVHLQSGGVFIASSCISAWSPDWANLRPLGDCLLGPFFFKNYKGSPEFWATFSTAKSMH
jgi:hypothetical protein